MSKSYMRPALEKEHLTEFRQFCEEWGWTAEDTKGEFEVLRMRNPNRVKLLIVHTKASATQVLTVHGESARMAEDFFGFGRGKK